MDGEEQQALNSWAESVVRLEPQVVDEILKAARLLSQNPKLKKSDREFAETQVRLILQARKKIGKNA